MKRLSATFISDPERKLIGGSTLRCECGWRGTISNATTILERNARGALLRQTECCPKCFSATHDVIVLLEDTFSPPLTLVEQANGDADRTVE